MKMHQIEVSLNGQEIVLTQPADGGFDEIVITADQAKFVCQWIMEAAQVVNGTQD
jgi:hypothetical protein